MSHPDDQNRELNDFDLPGEPPPMSDPLGDEFPAADLGAEPDFAPAAEPDFAPAADPDAEPEFMATAESDAAPPAVDFGAAEAESALPGETALGDASGGLASLDMPAVDSAAAGEEEEAGAKGKKKSKKAKKPKKFKAKSEDDDEEVESFGARLAKTSPYTVMLASALLALLVGILFLFLEVKSYHWDISKTQIRATM